MEVRQLQRAGRPGFRLGAVRVVAGTDAGDAGVGAGRASTRDTVGAGAGWGRGVKPGGGLDGAGRELLMGAGLDRVAGVITGLG